MVEEAGEEAVVADQVRGQAPVGSRVRRRPRGAWSTTPDDTLEIAPDRCQRCVTCLDDAEECGPQRRQVVDIRPAPPPKVTEYQRISKVLPVLGSGDHCGLGRQGGAGRARRHRGRTGIAGADRPETIARAALLTCAHYLPVGRARDLLEALTAIDISTGFFAGIRGRAARRLEKKFLAHMRTLLAGAPVLHADETPGRAAQALS